MPVELRLSKGWGRLSTAFDRRSCVTRGLHSACREVHCGCELCPDFFLPCCTHAPSCRAGTRRLGAASRKPTCENSRLVPSHNLTVLQQPMRHLIAVLSVHEFSHQASQEARHFKHEKTVQQQGSERSRDVQANVDSVDAGPMPAVDHLCLALHRFGRSSSQTQSFVGLQELDQTHHHGRCSNLPVKQHKKKKRRMRKATTTTMMDPRRLVGAEATGERGADVDLRFRSGSFST